MGENPGYKQGLTIGDERVIRECMEGLNSALTATHYPQKVSKLIWVSERIVTLLGQILMRNI